MNARESKPKKNKRPGWTRVVDIFLRIAHVAVTSILYGGAICNVPFEQLLPWHNLAIATGCGLIASEVNHSRHWLYQGRGIMCLFHVGLLGIIHVRPDLQAPVLTAVLAFGMAGSHMPKHFRYWSFVHGRYIE